ncbi:MAG: Ig-like domain-containing protein [Candidatus Doudnabacteria bacterium]|nr:Ig-like domain-containing protein [Candidatus Doudnabacteria bacterium]
MRKTISYILVVATLVWAGSLALLVEPAFATVTPTVTSLITVASTAKASSSPRAAIKVVIAVDAAETLTSLRVTATDSAATSFDPTVDLAALATGATSGVAIYNDAGSVSGSFDATDAVVTLSSASAWSSNSTTLTLASAGAAGTYYIVFRTASGAVNGHGFVLTLPTNGIDMSANDPTLGAAVATSAITIDTVAPTVNVNTTGPADNSTGVPISGFIHMGFSENIDQSTINPTNVTFTASGTPVASGIRSFPDGFDIVVSSPPTFAASSRFAKVNSTSTAFYNVAGTNAIVPEPPTGYASPTAGDIVITQRETFPPEAGVVTNATLTSGTFAVNGFTSFGGQQITKFATPAATSAVDVATAVTTGDIIVANTSANPTGVRYDWHIVTTGGVAINHANLRLDGASAAPTYGTHPGGGVSSFSSITPTATATDNGATANGTLAVTQGDLVFVQIGSTYGWHLVTSAGNMSSDATEGTAVVDGLTAGTSLVAASSQMSRLAPGAEGAVTASTALSFGDIVLAKTTANASNNNAYAFHMVTGADTIDNATGALRFDNFPGSLTPSTTYVVTATTGVKDTAGNALAANNTLTFTTGATGGTNTTPPFVQSSQPQSGSQNHPIGAPIRLTFSVDMAASGSGSIIADANIGLFTDVNGAPGTPVTTTKAYDSASKTVTLTPATLTAATGYIVKVNTTATSTTTAALSAPYFLSFRTPSGAADTTAPTVLGVSPANAATGISLGAIVTAGFSEDMDPSTISGTTVTLKKTSNSAAVTGNVNYNPNSRSVNFSPSVALEANTGYTFTILGGASDPRAKDLSANALAANYTSAFTTTATADTAKPFVTFSNADNFSVAVTFNESMKSGGGPNAVDNISNYTLATGAADAPSLTSVGLGGKTVTYEAGTRTARITGLSLVNGNRFSITVAINAQDLAGNAMDNTGTPVKNVSQGVVQDSSTTGGQIGPGGGTIDPGAQGMNPTRVTPMSKAAGATSNYTVNFLAGTSIPSGGSIVLTFPAGFTLASADKMAVANSGCNGDINMLASGTVGIASVAGNNDAGTVTITTNTAATGTNSFMCIDLINIVNSTVPSSSGYTVTIQTKDASGVALQTLTAAPFYLGQAGSRTLTVNVFKDANSNGTNNAGEGINGVTVYLFSPATGGQEATTANSTIDGVATFTSLADGEYMIGIKPNATIDVAFNSAPQPFTVSATSLTKNFALSNAAAITISGTITGANGTKVDVFASSQYGFTKKTVTLTGGADAYSLPVTPNASYNVGVGPFIAETFFTPGAPPPPPPDFTFMPPPNIQVAVAAVSVTGKNFTLSTADKTITGTVVDSGGTGVSSAGVFCRPVSTSTTGGTSGGFGTGGQTNTSGAFTLKTIEGVYLCGVFKPGMPPVSEKQITVGAAANTPTTLAFVLDASTSLSITGTIKDDSGNAIPYAGVSGRKVVSTTNTTAVGGDSGNFVGGPTDANGAYTLYVTAGTWVVEAFAPGFGRLGTKTITITTSNATGQDFSAQTLSIGTITGSATQATVGVQGVMVRAENSDQSSGNMVITGSDGVYTMKVPAGTYSIKCFFPGVGESTPITGVVVTTGGTTEASACALAAPITITVNITDGTNAIANAGVEVRDSNGRGNFTSTSTTTGANAVYTVVVPPGTYTVRAGHPAYGSLGTTTAVSTTQTITYNVGSSKQLYAVTGTVTGDAVALSGAWVSLNGTPTGQTNTVFLGAQTIANGTFSINVPPGTYRVRADKPGYKSPAESTATVTTATVDVGTIALTTAARTITGTITVDGSGVSNAFVDASDGNGGYAVAQTNAAGAYTLNVDNGTWTIRAHSHGYEGGPLPVTVASNSPTDQNLALTAISGFTIYAERPETITPTSGGFVTNTDIGTGFNVNFPANSLGTGSNAATVTTKVNTAMPNPPVGAILKKNAVSIDAVGADGSPISSLNDEITITIPYTEADLPAGTSEASLVIGVWNDANQTYDTLATTVDTTLNTLTATVEHLSDFAPLVASGGAPPATPTGLAGTAISTSSVNLSWTAVSGASTYNVYQSSDNSSFPFLKAVSDTSTTATSLAAGSTYYFKVSALNSTGDESAASSAVSVVVLTSGGGGGGGGGGGAVATPTPTTTPTTDTPSETSTPATGSAGAHPNGTLVLDNGTVWLIKNGQRTGFRKEAEYLSHGYNFGQAVAANAQDMALPQAEFVQKALEGTLVLDASDGVTVYMIGTGATKRGFTSETVFTQLGYNFENLPMIDLTDYPAGDPVEDSSLSHPDGALVLGSDGVTVWWVKGNTRQGFESEAVFNTYGFDWGKIVTGNDADNALTEGALVKFRDGTLVYDGGSYYLISDGQAKKFSSREDLSFRGYKTENAIPAALTGKYEDGGLVE